MLTKMVCSHCSDTFIASHEAYRIKQRIVERDGMAPAVLMYCSEACLNGLDPGLKDRGGHLARSMNTQGSGKFGESYVCLKCMDVWKATDFTLT